MLNIVHTFEYLGIFCDTRCLHEEMAVDQSAGLRHGWSKELPRSEHSEMQDQRNRVFQLFITN